jgi:hypothetical protein
MRKKLPYHKQFRPIDRTNVICPLAWVYFGPESWQTGKKFLESGRTLIMPPDGIPQDYDFKLVKNFYAICRPCGETDIEYRQRLAYEILKSGALQARFIWPSYKCIDFDDEEIMEYPRHEVYAR